MTVLYVNTFTKPDAQVPDDFVLSGQGGAVCLNQRWHLSTNTNLDVVRGILPAANWNQANIELTVDWITSGALEYPQIAWRTSGDWSTVETDSPNTGYKIVAFGSSGLALFKRVAGTTTQIGSTAVLAWALNTLYRCKIRHVGSAIQVRFWIPPAAEPSTWNIDTTDSAIPGPGQVQFMLLSTVAAQRTHDFDNLALDNTIVPVSSGPSIRLAVR